MTADTEALNVAAAQGELIRDMTKRWYALERPRLEGELRTDLESARAWMNSRGILESGAYAERFLKGADTAGRTRCGKLVEIIHRVSQTTGLRLRSEDDVWFQGYLKGEAEAVVRLVVELAQGGAARLTGAELSDFEQRLRAQAARWLEEAGRDFLAHFVALRRRGWQAVYEISRDQYTRVRDAYHRQTDLGDSLGKTIFGFGAVLVFLLGTLSKSDVHGGWRFIPWSVAFLGIGGCVMCAGWAFLKTLGLREPRDMPTPPEPKRIVQFFGGMSSDRVWEELATQYANLHGYFEKAQEKRAEALCQANHGVRASIYCLAVSLAGFLIYTAGGWVQRGGDRVTQKPESESREPMPSSTGAESPKAVQVPQPKVPEQAADLPTSLPRGRNMKEADLTPEGPGKRIEK